MHSTSISDSSPEYNNLQKKIKLYITLLAVYFITQTAPVMSFNNTIIYLHERYRHKGYGQTYLSMSSLGQIVAFLMGPYILRNIVNKINVKTILCFCSLGIMINFIIPMLFSIPQIHRESAEIEPPTEFRYILQIIANIIGGIPQGLTGILQGVIMATICKDIMQKKGKHFSYYNLVLRTPRALFSSLVTAFALGSGNQAIYYFSLSLLTFGSIFIAYFCLGFANKANPSQIPEYKAKCFNGMTESVSKMKYFILYMIFEGMMMGVVSASLAHLLPESVNNDSSQNDRNIGFVMLFMGTGLIGGGYINGKIYDCLGWRKTANIGLILFILALVAQIYFISVQHSFTNTCIIATLFGISIGFANCFFMITVTIYFQGSLQCFAVYKLIRLASYAIYPWAVSIISSQYPMSKSMISQCVFLIVLGIASFLAMNWFEPSKPSNFSPEVIQLVETQNQIANQAQLQYLGAQALPVF